MNLYEYYEFNTSNEFANYRKRMGIDYCTIYMFENKDKLDKDMPVLNNYNKQIFIGYNRIIAHIITTYNDAEYYVVERFDKHRSLLTKEGFRVIYIVSSVYKIGIIANATIEFDRDLGNMSIPNYSAMITKMNVTQKAKISQKSYKATSSAISEMCSRLLGYRESYNFTVKKTNMTKGEYKGLLNKLHIMGATVYIVELNTLAVVFNDKIELYSMQEIDYREYM
jgi:hypothetical protein